MIHPSYNELVEAINENHEEDDAPVVNSRYSVVLATSKRARQIIGGADTKVPSKGKKPLSVAVDVYKRQSVTCEMVNTEDYMPKGMSEKKYKWLRRMRTALVPVGLFFLITLLYGFQTGDFVLAVVLGISEVSIFVATLFPYRNLEE